MNAVLVTQVTAQPLDTKLIRDVTFLRHDVAAKAHEVSRVEGWLKFRDDQTNRIAILWFGPLVIVQLVFELWFGSRAPLRAFFEVLLEEWLESRDAEVT